MTGASLEDMYGEGSLSHGAVDELLDESLSPRGPDMLYDMAHHNHVKELSGSKAPRFPAMNLQTKASSHVRH